MHVPKRAQVKPHTAVTIRAAIVWLAPRAFSSTSEFPVQSVIDISVAKRILRTTDYLQ